MSRGCSNIEMIQGRAVALRKQLCDAEIIIKKLMVLELKQETNE